MSSQGYYLRVSPAKRYLRICGMFAGAWIILAAVVLNGCHSGSPPTAEVEGAVGLPKPSQIISSTSTIRVTTTTTGSGPHSRRALAQTPGYLPTS